MANTLKNLSGFQRGLEAAETGVNVESFSCRYYYQFKDYVNDYQGQIRGFAIPPQFSREVRMSGEIIGATGIGATTGDTAITFANDVSTWVGVNGGSNAGGFYLDEITETQTRDDFRSFEGTWTSNPGVS